MFLLRLGLAALALRILAAMFDHLEANGSPHLYLAGVFSVASLICLIGFVVLCITHIGERRSKR